MRRRAYTRTIYEWPAASVRRVRRCFTPASRLGTGLQLAAASGLPDLRLHFSAERRVPNLPPTPWPPHVAGRGRESRELPLLPENPQSACVSTAVSSIWDVVLRIATFTGEPCSEEADGVAQRWEALRDPRGEQGAALGGRIHQIPISSLRSGAGGEWVGARLRESDENFAIRKSPS